MTEAIEQVYRPRLENLFLPWCRGEGITDIAGIDQRVLDRWSGGLLERGGEHKAALSLATVASYARSINSFLAWAKREQEDVKGKVATHKLPERHIPVLSREEIDRMEKAAGNERDKVIVRALADTGIRVEELVGLTTTDIVEQDRRDYLLIHGKAGARVSTRDRLVPIPPRWRAESAGSSAPGRRTPARTRSSLGCAGTCGAASTSPSRPLGSSRRSASSRSRPTSAGGSRLWAG